MFFRIYTRFETGLGVAHWIMIITAERRYLDIVNKITYKEKNRCEFLVFPVKLILSSLKIFTSPQITKKHEIYVGCIINYQSYIVMCFIVVCTYTWIIYY